MNNQNAELIELGQDARKRHDHIVDSINLLIFTFLLILVILTVWLFKYKKFAYIHETGLAIIYGTIFGLIIRYGFNHTNIKSLNINYNNLSIQNIPEQIYLTVPNREESFVYKYKYPRVINESNSQDYEDKAKFDPEIFFNILLPPIIFNAGYSMKRRHFFKNFGAILTFAFAGTVISCFFIGGFMYCVISIFRSIKTYFSFTDCLFFGAIISATDPVTVLAIFNDQKVNVNLNAIIFGESVLNDAVSIILAQAIEKYSAANSNKFDMKQFFSCIYNFFAVFLGAFAMGSSMGCFTALLTKYTYIRQHSSLETALFILMSYSTFLAAEASGLTGIVSVLFCGIFQAHYTYNNLSKESQVQTKEIFNLLNFLSENFIFIYIGITLFTFGNHQWEFSYIFFALIGITLARGLNVYPLAFLINLSRSKNSKIQLNMQHLLFFSGLRGAMAFALAMRNTSTQARQLILTTTSIIVVITVIFCGGLTNKMLYWLKIKDSVDEETENIISEMNNLNNNNNMTSMFEFDGYHSDIPETETIKPVTKIARIKNIITKFSIFKAWHAFDNNFMKPLLTNTSPSLIDTMPKFCLPISRFLTTPEQSGLRSISNSQYSLVEPRAVKNPSRQTLSSLDNIHPIADNGEIHSIHLDANI